MGDLERPRILISACLLGERCRYDGGHKRDELLLQTIGPWLEWVPVCPESEAGLPTPREPMNLMGARLVTASGADVTDKVAGFTRRRVEALRGLDVRGFICKGGSPSCGLVGARGLFTAEFMRAFPEVPVIEAEQLHDLHMREGFIGRVFGPAASSPQVSVVMPVRDAAATIDEAIEGILRQSLDDIELVVVDDGSEDGTLERLWRWAGVDPRVRVFARQRCGLVPALNEGLRLARARLVARMDADDLSQKERLEKQKSFLDERQDVAVVGCLVEVFPRQTRGMLEYEAWVNSLVWPEEIAREIFVESPLPHPSVMFRRDVVMAAGGYRHGAFPEDYDLWLRLHAEGRRFAKVPKVLLWWRDSANRLTRRDPRYSFAAFRRLKIEHLDTFLLGRREVQICGAGPYAKAWGRELESKGIRVVRYLDVDPRKVGGRVGGRIPVVDWSMVDSMRDVPILCAVCRKGARPEIRQALCSMGFQEGADFIFVQ